MKQGRIAVALTLATGYFLLVMGVLIWYEHSLERENGGLLSGLVLAVITIPGVLYAGPVAALINCPRYSTCEHVVGAVFAGGVNAIIIFVVVHAISRLRKAR